jgi:hypothetical protein
MPMLVNFGLARENEALNANIGLVLTPRGAVLIDSGANPPECPRHRPRPTRH